MKKSLFKYSLAVWLAILLLLGNTPMDFIHQFADHKDTVHREHKGLVIEKKHHHCAYLTLTLTAFVNDYYIPSVSFFSPRFFSRNSVFKSRYVQRCIVAASLRGPPLA